MTSRRRAGAVAATISIATGLVGLSVFEAPAHAATYQGAAASMAPKVLASDVVHGLSALEAAYPHTATPGSTRMSVAVMVADRDPTAVTSLIDSVNSKGSPDYRQFPTPSQFNAEFGPAPATITAVRSWLASGGLSVYSHSATPGYLTATGTAAQVGALMHTSFVSFTTKGFLANTVGPTVPSAVLGVAGLNTGVVPRVTGLLEVKRGTKYDSPPIGVLSPMDLWDVYQQPATDEGQGQSMALFGLGTVDFGSGTSVESYLRQFEAQYNLPQIPYEVNYFESSPTDLPTDTSGAEEWILDAQAAVGMAPDANELVDYFGAALDDADAIGSYTEWADDPSGPLQGSTSYGSCEEVPETDSVFSEPGVDDLSYLGNPNQNVYEQVFAQLAAEGRTLFSASGDTGQGCGLLTDENGVTEDPDPVQNYPGISPNVVGVGGSVVYFNGESGSTPASRITEYPWPYSSGGRSFFEPANVWQAAATQPVSAAGTSEGAGLPVDPYTNYVDAYGNAHSGGFPARLQPDVGDLSGDIQSNGYNICDSGGCSDSEGGTSLSSPLWLGMWTRVQALEPANSAGQYVGLGFAEATIYQLAQASTYLQAFYNIGDPSETPPSIPTTNLSDVPPEGGFNTQDGFGVLDVKAFATLATGSTTYIPVDVSGTGPGGGEVPESPLAIGLPAIGLVVAAGLVLRRRRRWSGP